MAQGVIGLLHSVISSLGGDELLRGGLRLDHRVSYSCAPYAACDSDRLSTRMADLRRGIVAVPFRQPRSRSTRSRSANICLAALYQLLYKRRFEEVERDREAVRDKLQHGPSSNVYTPMRSRYCYWSF